MQDVIHEIFKKLIPEYPIKRVLKTETTQAASAQPATQSPAPITSNVQERLNPDLGPLKGTRGT